MTPDLAEARQQCDRYDFLPEVVETRRVEAHGAERDMEAEKTATGLKASSIRGATANHALNPQRDRKRGGERASHWAHADETAA